MSVGGCEGVRDDAGLEMLVYVIGKASVEDGGLFSVTSLLIYIYQ